MNDSIASSVRQICERHGNDRGRLMDIAQAVQDEFGCVSHEAMDAIASSVSCHRVEVEALVSFYAFFTTEPCGQIVIRLCNDVIDKLNGVDKVAAAFEEELGIAMGQTTPDGRFTLQWTPCMGMCDQTPTAMVNEVIVTRLSSDKAREIIAELREHMEPRRLVKALGDGNNAHDLVHAMVQNNVRKEGPMLFSPVNRGEAIRKAVAMSPVEVIRAVKTARLRGRGGAGFPAGMKWEFTRNAEGGQKYIVCNADEGEPGTFKDRVLLTERADRIFAGMTIAGYAIGATKGILYLRGEYRYLRDYLEHVLDQRRADGLLGHNVLGKEGFDFDISIQLGAGAYICGEETALLSSAEGLRGDPKNRPPFPAQKGYMGCPTSVNNVETLCCVTKILELGPASFNELGTETSSGTKLLSISGDCNRPGVYEVSFGISIREMLVMCGGLDAGAVIVGGASGKFISPAQFDRRIDFDDLATGGSIMVFGPQRDVLDIADAYMDFFIEESCGHCTPAASVTS
jgi:[NiFe] hydrogenase diaphorase moiety large subunit